MGGVDGNRGRMWWVGRKGEPAFEEEDWVMGARALAEKGQRIGKRGGWEEKGNRVGGKREKRRERVENRANYRRWE